MFYYVLFKERQNKGGLLLKKTGRYLHYQLQLMILQIHLLVSAPTPNKEKSCKSAWAATGVDVEDLIRLKDFH